MYPPSLGSPPPGWPLWPEASLLNFHLRETPRPGFPVAPLSISLSLEHTCMATVSLHLLTQLFSVFGPFRCVAGY